MTTLRCGDRKAFFARLLLVALFCLALHCVLAYSQGARGAEMFNLGDVNRVRTFLLAGLILGVTAYVSFPRSENKKDRAENAASAAAPTAGSPVPPAQPQPETAVAEPAPAVPPTTSPAAPVAPDPAPAAAPAEVHAEPVPAETPAPTPAAPSAPDPAPVAASVEVQASSAPKPDGMSADGSAKAVGDMVAKMWKTARTLKHNFIPNPKADNRYLSLVHGAAMSGHAEAQAKLGEYAFRRGALVEAYYWLTLSQLNGNPEAEKRMRDCRAQWIRSGCSPEYGNVYEFFTERQSSLGRAVLRLDSGILVDRAIARLKDMIAEGEVAAVLVLEQRGLSSQEETS